VAELSSLTRSLYMYTAYVLIKLSEHDEVREQMKSYKQRRRYHQPETQQIQLKTRAHSRTRCR